jgi:transcriptional regulator with XRE-family HTH domain
MSTEWCGRQPIFLDIAGAMLKLKERHKWSQPQLASLLGISGPSVEKYLARLPHHLAVKLADLAAKHGDRALELQFRAYAAGESYPEKEKKAEFDFATLPPDAREIAQIAAEICLDPTSGDPFEERIGEYLRRLRDLRAKSQRKRKPRVLDTVGAIVELKERHLWTQDRLASLLGISSPTLDKYTGRMPQYIALKLADLAAKHGDRDLELQFRAYASYPEEKKAEVDFATLPPNAREIAQIAAEIYLDPTSGDPFEERIGEYLWRLRDLRAKSQRKRKPHHSNTA